MIKIMLAKFPGKCCRTGAPIRPGDEIKYDTFTRQAWITDEDDQRGPFVMVLDDPELGPARVAEGYTTTPARYVSHIWTSGGREYYQNVAGLCEDAPACGCCNA
jgi:hypothetical protein